PPTSAAPPAIIATVEIVPSVFALSLSFTPSELAHVGAVPGQRRLASLFLLTAVRPNTVPTARPTTPTPAITIPAVRWPDPSEPSRAGCVVTEPGGGDVTGVVTGGGGVA